MILWHLFTGGNILGWLSLCGQIGISCLPPFHLLLIGKWGKVEKKIQTEFFFKLHFYEGINSRHRYLIFFSPPLLLKICFIATRTELQGLGFNASYLVHLNILTVALFHFSLRHVLGKSGDLSPIVKLAGTTGTTGSISDWNTSIYSGNYSNRLYGSQS